MRADPGSRPEGGGVRAGLGCKPAVGGGRAAGGGEGFWEGTIHLARIRMPPPARKQSDPILAHLDQERAHPPSQGRKACREALAEPENSRGAGENNDR